MTTVSHPPGSGEVFTVAPAFVMPYMSGRSVEVEKALFLMRFHVPCWAIAEVFGHDPMYGYRLEQGLGRFRLVGTTVKRADRVPTDLVADEKHSWLKGERVYIATTAGQECILGASVAKSSGQADLQDAYGVFAEAARALDPDDAPETVAWQPTRGAWKALFEHVTLILCFLHAFLKSGIAPRKPWVRSARRCTSGCGRRIMPRVSGSSPSVYVGSKNGSRPHYRTARGEVIGWIYATNGHN